MKIETSLLRTTAARGRVFWLFLTALIHVDAFVIRQSVASSRTAAPKASNLTPLRTSPKPVFPPQVAENETDCELTPVDFSDEILTEDLNPARDLDEGDDDLHWFRFGAVGRLYEDDQNSEEVVLDRLKRARVAVVGMGGIGSWVAEALCRSGIGHLVLVDLDDICISNTNRQLHTLSTNVGSMKTDVMRDRLIGINPYINITLIHDFIMLDNVQEVVGEQLQDLGVDIVVDAIDGVEEKTALISACADYGVPVVTTGSPAGKNNPTQIVCKDLTQVRGDRLLRSCRDRLSKTSDFKLQLQNGSVSAAQNPWNIPAVFSEQGVKENEPPETDDAPVFASFRNDGLLGTACFVTGTFGFVAASRVVEMIVDENLVPPSRE